MARSSLIVSIVALVALSGCARTVVVDPLVTTYPADDVQAELAYWHSLPSRSAVSNDEGLHGLILLADTEDAAGSYEARVTLAKERGWLSEGFDEPANLAMQRGSLARSIAVICKIKGGVMMQLTGPNARYATRELVSMGMIPEGSSENQSITGLEFMSVITQAQDYLNAGAPAAPTPASPIAPGASPTPAATGATTEAPGASAVPAKPSPAPGTPEPSSLPQMTPIPSAPPVPSKP
ncbi:MAG: hypothetical protein K2X32_00780 [Phycisphaerales bacterium]|nr:hypothetical protein [Phycisphaerales bacterium]